MPYHPIVSIGGISKDGKKRSLRVARKMEGKKWGRKELAEP